MRQTWKQKDNATKQASVDELSKIANVNSKEEIRETSAELPCEKTLNIHYGFAFVISVPKVKC